MKKMIQKEKHIRDIKRTIPSEMAFSNGIANEAKQSYRNAAVEPSPLLDWVPVLIWKSH